jgi:hypothetical protein
MASIPDYYKAPGLLQSRDTPFNGHASDLRVNAARAICSTHSRILDVEFVDADTDGWNLHHAWK